MHLTNIHFSAVFPQIYSGGPGLTTFLRKAVGQSTALCSERRARFSSGYTEVPSDFLVLVTSRVSMDNQVQGRNLNMILQVSPLMCSLTFSSSVSFQYCMPAELCLI